MANPRVDPAAYAAVMKVAYEAVKSVQPNSIVLQGGIASEAEPYGGVTWTTNLYAQGFANFFDHANHHPYCYGGGAFPLGSEAWSSINLLTGLYDVMTANGDAGKKIWMTEAGSPTGTVSAANPYPMTEANVARTYRELYQLQRANAWAGPLLPYSAKDAGTDLTDEQHNFGVLKVDWSRKQSLAEFQVGSGGAARGFAVG
jgi:hypothetical protein